MQIDVGLQGGRIIKQDVLTSRDSQGRADVLPSKPIDFLINIFMFAWTIAACNVVPVPCRCAMNEILGRQFNLVCTLV